MDERAMRRGLSVRDEVMDEVADKVLDAIGPVVPDDYEVEPFGEMDGPMEGGIA